MTTDTSTGSAPQQTRRIPPPASDREPLKNNIFSVMTGANCQLIPLFPYHDAGTIVPCGAILASDPEDSEWGHFFHYNTVEEVALCFGSDGGLVQTGQVFVTQQLHGVNSFLRDPSNPGGYLLMTITQHQSEEGDQSEAILYRCRECHHELYRLDYNSTPKGAQGYDPSQWGGSDDDEVPMFATIWGGTTSADVYNDESVRTCPKCGFVNPAHPQDKWGWQRYVSQVRVADTAKRKLLSVAADDAKGA